MCAASASRRIAAKAARVSFEGRKRIHHPGLANLLEVVRIIEPAAHSIEILSDDGMIVVWEGKPIHGLGAIVASGSPDRQANLRPAATRLIHRWQITYDEIRAENRSEIRCRGGQFA